MDLGEKLLELRKKLNLSQEEAAEKLYVTRQTISKWETNQSTPDFDKIIPICELYGITPDELFNNMKAETECKSITSENSQNIRKKKALGIGLGVLGYFIAISWISVSIVVFKINPVLASSLFLIICGLATFVIVYSCINYKKPKTEQEIKEKKLVKQICSIISIIILIIYLLLSFITGAWHLTWILWIIYGLIEEIVKLIFMLKNKENNNEK